MANSCNINKRRVEHISYSIIRNILKDSEYMEIEKIITQLSNKTRNISIHSNKKKKTIMYAIKFYFHSFDEFIKQSSEFSICNELNKKYVYLLNKINEDWILIDNEDNLL